MLGAPRRREISTHDRYYFFIKPLLSPAKPSKNNNRLGGHDIGICKWSSRRQPPYLSTRSWDTLHIFCCFLPGSWQTATGKPFDFENDSSLQIFTICYSQTQTTADHYTSKAFQRGFVHPLLIGTYRRRSLILLLSSSCPHKHSAPPPPFFNQ